MTAKGNWTCPICGAEVSPHKAECPACLRHPAKLAPPLPPSAAKSDSPLTLRELPPRQIVTKKLILRKTVKKGGGLLIPELRQEVVVVQEG